MRTRWNVMGFALVLWLATGTARADSVTPFGPAAGSRAGVDDMALLEGAKGNFADKYTIEAELEGGGDLYFSVNHANLGTGAEFEVKARYRAPDGTTYRTSETLSGGQWKVAKGSEIDIQMGKHRLQGTPQKWTFTAEGPELTVSATFEPTAPPWRPGNGRAYFGGRQHYIDMTVLAPRASVTGTLKAGGAERALTGTGYALHTYSTLAPYETARRWVSFRGETGPVAFYVKEFVPAERWGEAPVRWLLVARKGAILFQSVDFTLTPDEVTTDDKHENRYRVPHLLRIEAKDGEDTLQAVVKAGKLRERADRLAEMSAVKRAIAAQFAKPVYYAFLAQYQIRLMKGGKEQTFKGRGIYELDHLNK